MNFWFFKTQIVCFILLVYVLVNYCRERSTNNKRRANAFIALFVCAVINLFLDVITVYTVNHVDTVNPTANLIFHFLFLMSIATFERLLFRYIGILCKLSFSKIVKFLIFFPYLLGFFVALFSINSLEYINGESTNYSMGMPVYSLYAVVLLYSISGFIVFIKRKRYMTKKNYYMLMLSNIIPMSVLIIQMIFPEVLITSFFVTFYILTFYQVIENGSYERNEEQQIAMIHAMADIVESRDKSTGGHIKRTSAYAELLAQRLRKSKEYKGILTQDYIEALILAAPMHDIGKISIPDNILQKPGKLTFEEYETMKTHSTHGAELVEHSVSIQNQLYKRMIFEMAYYHHEKWNGKGYPLGLKEGSIPLCARIMAVVDVFDAVSSKRCYRDALSLDESFEIIRQGSGVDFDPVVAKCFLENRKEVEKIHAYFTEGEVE